jgi:hypothetical protein
MLILSLHMFSSEEPILSINESFFQFVEKNLGENVNKLRLKKFNEDFDVKFAILQIECLCRIKKKLPEIYDKRNFLFPNILATEQCTAEIIAKFHASLFRPTDKVLDMTAGLCIDTYYIAKKVESVTAIEVNPEIANIGAYNMRKNASNVNVICSDSAEYINKHFLSYDAIFIDPARRGQNNTRLYAISDCFPNVINLLPAIRKISNRLYVKASAMIDITQAIRDLPEITDVWILGIKNECKELLFKLDFSQKVEHVFYHTINFDTDGTIQELSYLVSEDSHMSENRCDISVGMYLYEPNCCVMKAAAFAVIANRYGLKQIQGDTHLFVTLKLIKDFPGRRFVIREILPFKNSMIKNIRKKYPQLNVAVRNFRIGAAELKKKLGVKDGGDFYLFGITNASGDSELLFCGKE